MDFDSSPPSDHPELLRTLASSVGFSEGNVLLHQFVIDNSHPNDYSGSENYINAVLLSMSDAPAGVVNALNAEGYCALHLAVLKNNLTMVDKLLSCLRNIDVNARCPWLDENTPLHMAAELGHLPIVRELLNRGAGIDVRNAPQQTALCLAAGTGHLDVVQLLVSRGADVSPVSVWGTTPLFHAAESGNLAAVEFLVNSGADVSEGSVRQALLQAATSGHSDVVKFLFGLYSRFDNGSDLGASDLLLSSAVASGSLAAVECLVGSGVGGGTGSRPLHSAVYARSLEIVEYLVSRHGVDVGAAADYGRTPLHAAAFVDSAEIAAFLLDRGADLEARDEFGMTPLHVATYWGRFGVVKLLVGRGADRHAKNVHGTTPLQSAFFWKNAEIAEFLSEQKDDWTL